MTTHFKSKLTAPLTTIALAAKETAMTTKPKARLIALLTSIALFVLPVAVPQLGGVASATPVDPNGAHTAILKSGQALYAGQHLTSPDGQYTLTMQGDGNLVLSQGNTVLWNSYAASHMATPGSHLAMQAADGNLVVYSPSGQVMWSANTWGFSNDYLQLQDDGNLVIYQGTHPVWAYGPGYIGNALGAGGMLMAGEDLISSNHQYQLTMQSDGNLVLSQGNTVLWNSYAASHMATPGSHLAMQAADGNLVVYSPSGQVMWSTYTQGHPGSYLQLNPDSTLVILSPTGQQLWPTRPTSPPWDPALGYFDEHDYFFGCSPTTGVCPDPGEYGIDVPLQAGTAIRAPQAGTIIAYQQWPYKDPCGIAWCPGRLLVKLSTGAVVGFGHVNPFNRISAGASVAAGQEIATVACNHYAKPGVPGCLAPTDPQDGDHVEFMYSPLGGYATRADFTSYPPADPRSPFSVLKAYMTGS